ncbi:MAG: C-terminal binding protein, partial [Inquilinus sp.]|nr:C-terminal binding protein [Inquilinus sp.]
EVERRTAGEACSFEIHRLRDAAAIPAGSLETCDALLVWHEIEVTPALVARLTRCRVIVRAGAGFDNIDLGAAGAAGIAVANTPDYGTSEVADHAIALMLSLTRGIARYHETLVGDPVGAFTPTTAPLPRRIRGRRLGIVGLGRIGTATALRAKAFGMEVIAHDPYLPRGQEIAVGVARADLLDDLLRQCDVGSLHTPLNDETRGLIGAEALAVMPAHAILVNTARGAIVDIDALHGALKESRIAGAALDVLPEEPPPEPLPPLIAAYAERADWLAGRLVLTPHAAWYSPESAEDVRRKSVETLLAHLVDGEPRNCVNLEVLNRARRGGPPAAPA